MQPIIEFFQYLSAQKIQIISLILEHIRLTLVAVGCAVSVGVPLGILITYVKRLNKPVMSLANLIQAVPSLALLGFAIPFLGIGTLPAVCMVILYSLLPIVKNTSTGLSHINAQTIEAAKGIGLTKFQILYKIQIPLALPIIMAGVRISAVTAVGLMTIAAFVGAGGLGFLVFSGIRTVNNFQILAGAVPAALLALTVDYTALIIEKLVTPISLQNISGDRKAAASERRRQIIGLSFAALALFILYGRAFPKKSGARTITVASKEFTEQEILGHMLAQLIEGNTDISVNKRLNLGGTIVLFEAVRKGDIQLYVEYGGTAYGNILKHPPITDPVAVYETSKKEFKEQFDLDLLTPFSFNNTYAMAVRQDTAQQYNLDTLSDFANVANRLSMAATLEFINRQDGLIGLQKKYAFQTAKVLGMDGSPRYVALDSREADVINAYSTDGLIKKFNLKVLKDDKNFFLPYYAVPVIRADARAKFPEIEPLLNKLGPLLVEDIMINLNYQVDVLRRDPGDVAREFLKEHKLIK